MIERELSNVEQEICEVFSKHTVYSLEAVIQTYRRVRSYDVLETMLLMATRYRLALPDAAPESD